MSRTNIIKENNKKLFESRLQMKPKTGVKRSQISFEHKKFNDAIYILNNSQPFTKIIFQKKLKNHSTLDNSFLNNINNNNNSALNNKIIKINKNNTQKNKKININLSQNKSNILLKDITFFHLKKSPKNNNKIHNRTIINVNKRITKENSKKKNLSRQTNPKINQIGTINLNIKKYKKMKRNLNLINSITRSMTTINETNNNITINNSNYIMNNTNININNINNGNNRVILKEKFIPKFKITNDMFIKIPNRQYKTNLNSNRNNSSSNKKYYRNNSFKINKIQKFQKVKFGKNKKISFNFNKRLNEVILGTSLNQKGRNSINLFKNNNKNNNKKTIDICKEQTQRNLFLGKYLGKLLQKNNNKSIKNTNNNSRNKKQNNTLNFDNYYYYYDYDNRYNSNRNLNNKNSIYLNNILFHKDKENKEKEKEKEKEKKISRNTKNNINNKRAYNKNIITGDLKTFNKNSNQNLISKNFNSNEFNQFNDIFNQNFNKIINKRSEFKDTDKIGQTTEDNINPNNTKINDNFFSSEKNKKINDTSIEEDSGILSINEVQDIIYYDDMCEIKKEYNFLFNYKDYDDFITKYRKNIYHKFFDSDNNDKFEINLYELKSKKKNIIVKNNK